MGSSRVPCSPGKATHRVSRWHFIVSWGARLTFVLGALATCGQSNLVWTWSNPTPHGNNIADLVHRAGVYVQVTDYGGIYVSTNRVVWERRETGTLREMRGAAFMGDRLLVTGEEGIALWSDDAVRFERADVQPPTTDWLEGVAASQTVAVAVGDNGSIYRSVNGELWSQVEGLPFTDWLSGVAYGNSTFVAVGESGFIASSTNGLNWTRRSSGTNRDLTRVAFGSGRFLVVGVNGIALTSTNGVSWTEDGTTGTTSDLLAAAVSPNLHLAVGDAALRLLRPPARPWEDQFSLLVTPSPAPEWSYLAAAWDGTRFLAAGLTGVAVESLQTNFPGLQNVTLWFRLDDSPRNWLWDATRLGGTYLAVGDHATIMSSPLGSEWTLESSDLGSDTVLFGVGGSSNLAIVVGQNGTILRSPAIYSEVAVTNLIFAGGRTNTLLTTNHLNFLGLDWHTVDPPPTTNTLQGVAYNGDEYLAVGAQGTVVRSADGTNWVSGSIPSTAFFSTVVAGPSGWVAGGTGGAIFTSTNSMTWAPVNSGVTNWIYRIRRFSDRLIAVGQGGLILESADGSTWLRRESGTTNWLTDVTQVGNVYFASGVQGTILQSADGVLWDTVRTITGKALYALAHRRGQLITVGAEGVILRTLANPLAAPVEIAAFDHRNDASPSVDLFLFEGTPDQSFRLERSPALGEWETAGEFQLGPGGRLLLGLETADATRFYRTVVNGN